MPKVIYRNRDDDYDFMDDANKYMKFGVGLQQMQANQTAQKGAELDLEMKQGARDEFFDPLNVETRANEAKSKNALSFANLTDSVNKERTAIGTTVSGMFKMYKQEGFDTETASNSFAQQIGESTGGKVNFTYQPVQREDGSQAYKATFRTKEGDTQSFEYSDFNELQANVDSIAMKAGYYSRDKLEAAGVAQYADAVISSLKPDELKQFGTSKDEIMNNPEFSAIVNAGYYSGKNSTEYFTDLRKEARDIDKHKSELGRTDLLNKATMLDIAVKHETLNQLKSGEGERKLLERMQLDSARIGLDMKQLEGAENTQKYIKDTFSFFQTAPIYDPMDSTKLIGYEPLPIEKQKILLAIPKIVEGYDPSEPYTARVVAATQKAIETYDKMQKKGDDEPKPEPKPEPVKLGVNPAPLKKGTWVDPYDIHGRMDEDERKMGLRPYGVNATR